MLKTAYLTTNQVIESTAYQRIVLGWATGIKIGMIADFPQVDQSHEHLSIPSDHILEIHVLQIVQVQISLRVRQFAEEDLLSFRR